MSGNTKGTRRRFGSVRHLPSGRWQARYLGPDGLPRTAPRSFDTKRAAEQWLVATEAEMMRGDWLDSEAGKISLSEYADRWVKERDLKARTREEYERHLRLHVRRQLGMRALADITSAHVRSWRAELLEAGVGKSTVAKTYRILHAILATAVDDDLLRRNPCRIKGAGQEKTDERPRPWTRCSPSLERSSRGIGFSYCWRRSHSFASASSWHSDAGVPTWT